MINRPAQRGRNGDRDHQLNADAKAEAKTLLQDRAVGEHRLPLRTLRPCPIYPLAELRQRIRRPALAHSDVQPNDTRLGQIRCRSAAQNSDEPLSCQRAPALPAVGWLSCIIGTFSAKKPPQRSELEQQRSWPRADNSGGIQSTHPGCTKHPCNGLRVGGAEGDRTPDLRIANAKECLSFRRQVAPLIPKHGRSP
jgi:hypothetical protein